MTNTEVAQTFHVGHGRIAGNATVHQVSWVEGQRPTTTCGADTRYVARRVVVTDDAITCKRCGGGR